MVQQSVVLLILYVLHFNFAAELDFTVEIPAGRMQCFFQEVSEPNFVTMEVDYQVINGGDLNINFLLADPNGRVLGQDIKRTDNTHKIDVSGMKGDYQLCFDNTFSYQAFKIVFFQVFLFDNQGNSDDTEYSKLTGISSSDDSMQKLFQELGITAEDFKNTAVRIKNNLNQAEHLQNTLRGFELRDRSIMEANFERVNFWSVVSIVVMVVVALIQVYTIRSLFEDSSRIGKLLRHKH